MRPPDAIDGWDDDNSARQYARFCRDYPFYSWTSKDLAARARLAGSRLAVDLCGGTGVTAQAMLTAMPPGSILISVDSAAAMQRAAQRWLTDSRLIWVTAAAEALAEHVSGPADAVVCNSAIWKTATPAVFAAVKHVLRPGGLFVFNIGGGFAGLSRPGGLRTPSLTDLIDTIAARDYGYLPQEHDPGRP